ncbi:hypothetical protein [Corynebacterium nasicanis]|uniref:Uncharacterized protein n=1 Tax=Corynebacterium nasicanis TaxID=1448267 RepID=A0ABW1QC33_9CORY
MNTSEARELLDHAEATSRRAASFSLAWLCYIALCAGGAITALGVAYANVTDTSPFPAWMAGGLWILIGVTFTAVTSTISPPVRRGFNSRWSIMIAVWVVAWLIVSVLNSHFTLGHGIALSAAFMSLAILGPLWEIVAVKKS